MISNISVFYSIIPLGIIGMTSGWLFGMAGRIIYVVTLGQK